MTDMAVTFLLVVVIGAAAGVIFDRIAGPGWLARQFAGRRGTVTSALVGVAGSSIGYFVALLAGLGGLVWHILLAIVGAVLILLAWRAIR